MRSLTDKSSHGHGHVGTSSSAATTVGTPSGTPTPSTSAHDVITDDEKMRVLDEKLLRRKSFTRASLAPLRLPSKSSASQGLSEETREKGRVQLRVYQRYIQAASWVGFALFVSGAVLQQVLSVASNIALKSWGEGNRNAGDNLTTRSFLWVYGWLSLSSTLLGGGSVVILWVLCSLRSSKHLHDSVSTIEPTFVID